MNVLKNTGKVNPHDIGGERITIGPWRILIKPMCYQCEVRGWWPLIKWACV